MALVPLNGRVVIKQKAAEEKTAGGLFIPGAAAEKLNEAEVIEVSPDNSTVIAKGDKVIYSKYAGTDIKYEEEDYIIIKETDILAIINE